jgi:hypothetical protein
VPVDGAADTTSIEEKFGISGVSGLTGAAAVDAAFHELSAFIKKGGLSAQPAVIHLGDWIDLESLTVVAYGDGDGGFNARKNDPVTPDPLPFEGYEGSTLRLIVVGINSFQPNEPYNVSANAGVGHVVFQFQNTPVSRRMNETDTNDGGYAASEMREYLAGVDGNGGNFLAGLKTARVPEDVLWGPVRYISNGYNGTPRGADALTDLLWLPTAWELFGSQSWSFAEEKAENQARLKYYTDNTREYRIKFVNSQEGYGDYYWESSPNSGGPSLFCNVGGGGYGGTSYNSAGGACGVAPAFCVR